MSRKFFDYEVENLLQLYQVETDPIQLNELELEVANESLRKNIAFYLSSWIRFSPGESPPFFSVTISLRLNDRDTIGSKAEGYLITKI